jgi:hypothetical protein
MVAFKVWQIYYIDLGRNWARILFLVLFLLGIPMWISSVFRLYRLSFILEALTVVIFVIEVVALALLFGRDARPWFGCVKSDSSSTSEDADRKS